MDHRRGFAALLEFLSRRASNRKLRLFACACARRVLEASPGVDNSTQTGLLIAEALADGGIDQAGAIRARTELQSLSPYSGNWSASGAVRAALDLDVYLAAESAASHAANHFGYARGEPKSFLARFLGSRQAAQRKRVFQATSILRDIFGNPFRPARLNRAWLMPTISGLAESMYGERVFDRMLILGDALEEAGCGDEDILSHCRSGGAHARGCWVIDLLLGKE